MQLIELIEVLSFDYLQGKEISDVYEVYKGDFVELYDSSANAYWHTVEWWQENRPEITPYRRRPIKVLCGPRVVGYWDSVELFYQFIKIYLRGAVVDTVSLV